ncbi:MAG: beta-propeller domain-containing protein [Polyangiaceae bacterium]|nr:beta-propeller domain-containing protein [Polyangiaceae bacterium]
MPAGMLFASWSLMIHFRTCSTNLLRRHRASLIALTLFPTVLACEQKTNEFEETDGAVLEVPAKTETQGQPLIGDGFTDFISYLPNHGNEVGFLDHSVAESPPSAESAVQADDATGGAERAIAEADIIQKEGSTLYALSRFSGISVIDIENPAQMKLQGNLRFPATPFEMYLEGDTAYIMFNDYGRYEEDHESQQWAWVESSRMQAIDVSNPSAMKVLGDFEVPGSISDSRKVGDIIYLVTYQGSWCWHCDDSATTRVTSFDAAEPASFRKIDEISFQDSNDGWSSRSVSVTSERAYISGWNWGSGDDGAGTIDVVDISAPDGALAQGASIRIAGQIASRWQMEEEDNILRVISQPGGWGTTTPPVLETFRVDSASSVESLASLDLVLPRPEDLRSVRFDGDRAYAITFERTDPLFTFDLSDPENPRQLGELEIPGWVYHMEPRGDRIYALGFDTNIDNASLNVSLFDVSQLDDPQMLKRVHFGGDWANFAEDQNRIHKAFNILDEQGLILVPFSGSHYSEENCSRKWESGIQLVDFTKDDLTLRGVADQLGTARRSFLANEHLVGVSDHAVQAFDISDRDEPMDLDQIEVARNVNFVKKLDEGILRFGRDWWTERTILDLTDDTQVEVTDTDIELDLTNLGGENGWSCQEVDENHQVWRSADWSGQVFVNGDYAYVPRYENVSWFQEEETSWEEVSLRTLEFFVVHLKAENGPRIISSFSVEPTGSRYSSNHEFGDEIAESSHFGGLVQTENALLVGRSTGTYSSSRRGGNESGPTFSYDVIDIRDAANPQVVSKIEVPSLWARGGWSYGFSGCAIDMAWGWWGWQPYGYFAGEYDQNALVSGNFVASQHEEPLNDGSGRVRYYLDRLDLSDPQNPILLNPVNIPGQLVNYNDVDHTLVTIDWVSEEVNGQNWRDCHDQDRSSDYYFDEQRRKCVFYQRRVNTLELRDDLAWRKGMKNLEANQRVGAIAVTDSRIFYVAELGSQDGESVKWLGSLAIDGEGYLSELEDTDVQLRTAWGSANLFARGDRAFMTSEGQLQAVDTATANPSSQVFEKNGWSCTSFDVTEDTLYCALGQYGVSSFDLE